MARQASKHKIINIIRFVALTVVAIVIGLSVYNWNAQNLTGNKMPMPLGFGASIVLSGSMEPTLLVDDLVIIKKTNTIKENDIVVFQNGSSLVIHRVIAINGNTITTKGDANNTADKPITKYAIKGKLVCAIPFVGVIVGFLKQPIVIIILLLGVMLLTECSYAKEKYKDTYELNKIKNEIKELKNS